jgi:hypothetical protein
MYSFLLVFAMSVHFSLAFSTLLEFAFLLVILELFVWSLFVLHGKVIPPLDMQRQTQMPCVKMLTYLIY